jgi:hypothetical protein
MGRGLAYTRFWWGNLKERNHSEDRVLNGDNNGSLGSGMEA